MSVLEDTERWVIAYSGEINVQLKNVILFKLVQESSEKKSKLAKSFNNLIEFSFFTSNRSVQNRLRYIINISKLNSKATERSIRKSITSFGNITKTMINDLGFWGLNNIINETERFLLAAIGAEHNPNGSMLAFKTYWRFNSSLNELNVLLNRDSKKSFLKVINKAQSFWSDWKKPKLIGIDYLLKGETKLKVYLPQKGFSKPLSIVDLCLFLLNCGWKVNLDIFPNLSYFILGNQSKVEPSAYSICISGGKEPYIKLEIAAKAYFKNANETLKAVTNLAESLFLDSYSIYCGFLTLKKHNPFPLQLLINVISIYFFPDGSNRITIYCGL